MDDIELKRLNKRELIDLLQAEKARCDELTANVEELQAALDKREIAINKAGSIAEASMELSGVFEAAQRAADEYIANCKRLTSRSDEIIAEREAESKLRAKKIISDAEKAAQAKYDLAEKMIENAERDSERIRKEADEYWNSLQNRLQSFYDEHQGLIRLLNGMNVNFKDS